MIFVAAAALLFASCEKNLNTNEICLPEGREVSFTLDNPTTDDIESKVTEAITGTTHEWSWETGDQFVAFFWKPGTGASPISTDNYLANVVFTATEGGSPATFTGTLPDDMNPELTRMYAIYPAFNITTVGASAADKYSLTGANLPAIQDGKGYTAAHFSSKNGVFDHATGTFTTKPKFYLANAMIKMGVDPALGVTKITVTVDYPESTSTTKQYAAGNIKYATNSTGDNSGGSEASITVYDGGKVLPSDVYIAIRHTVSNATYKTGKLIFSFYSEKGVATKTLVLADKDGNYVNLSAGRIYNIGSFNSSNLVFEGTKVISWTGNKSVVTMEGPDGASYKGFPYANDSSAGSVTQILDGKDGDVLVEGKTYTEEKAYKIWTDKSRKEYNILTVGVNTLMSGAYYYSPKNIYQMRFQYGYVIIPAIEGYKLANVYAKFDNAADSNVFSICSDMSSKTPTTIDGISKKPVSVLTDADYATPSALPNTPYYMYIDGGRVMSAFVFTYTEVKTSAEPAGQGKDFNWGN